MIVRTLPGLEACVQSELSALKIAPGASPTGGQVVVQDVTARQLYMATTLMRCASRVLVPIVRFRAASFAELERAVKRLRRDGRL